MLGGEPEAECDQDSAGDSVERSADARARKEVCPSGNREDVEDEPSDRHGREDEAEHRELERG